MGIRSALGGSVFLDTPNTAISLEFVLFSLAMGSRVFVRIIGEV